MRKKEATPWIPLSDGTAVRVFYRARAKPRARYVVELRSLLTVKGGEIPKNTPPPLAFGSLRCQDENAWSVDIVEYITLESGRVICAALKRELEAHEGTLQSDGIQTIEGECASLTGQRSVRVRRVHGTQGIPPWLTNLEGSIEIRTVRPLADDDRVQGSSVKGECYWNGRREKGFFATMIIAKADLAAAIFILLEQVLAKAE